VLFHPCCLRFVRRQLGHDVTAKPVSATQLAFFTSRLLQRRSRESSCLDTGTLCTESCMRQQECMGLNLKPRDHVTPALRELHWRPIAARTDYTNCLLVHKTSLGHTPAYIVDLFTSVASIPARFSLRGVHQSTSILSYYHDSKS